MIFREGKWESKSKQRQIKENWDLIKKIYKDYNDNDCFIFLANKFYSNNIAPNNVIIKFYDNNDREIKVDYKSKIGTPYPNKRVYFNRMKYGRKIFKYGLVFKFTKKQINNLHKIEIIWSIGNKKVITIYNTKFELVDDNKIFSIHSYDEYSEYSYNYERYLKQFDINNKNGNTEIHGQLLKLKSDDSTLDFI